MRRGRLIQLGAVAAVLVLALTVIVAPGATVSAAPGPNAGLQHVFIGFDRTPGPAERALVEGVGGNVQYSYTLVPAIAAHLPQGAIAGLERNPRVAYIEPVIEVSIVDHGSELSNTWGVQHIGAGDVHHDGNEGSGVRVAVLDTGIATNHPDLAYAPACSGSTSYTSVADGNGHGTHVAGTVAALKNGQGVVGVAPDVTLCVYKVLSNSGGGSYDDVVAALDAISAFNQGRTPSDQIRVTNNSYGSSGDPGTTVKNAFDTLANEGVLHVAAAGNSGSCSGNDNSVGFPARWDSLIAVAATNANDVRPCFSSTGPAVELSAPGVSVCSAWSSTVRGPQTCSGMNHQPYRVANGTSMASPHAAGVAALVFAGSPEFSNVEVRKALHDSAIHLGPAHQYGYGLVNAPGAVGIEPAPPAIGTIAGTVTDEATGAPIEGATVAVSGTDLSATTDSEGAYNIADVPVGEHQVTVSESGYEASTEDATVNAGETTTVDFALTAEAVGGAPDPDPSDPGDGTVTVSDITYSTTGNGRHLRVTVGLVDEDGNAVSGASVTIELSRNDALYATATGSTGSSGEVTFQFNHAPAGCYETEVTSVVVSGETFNPETPPNGDGTC